jgi:signal transduction histidine kinase
VMAGEQSRAQVAREVEHAVWRLDGLSILPDAARRFLSGLFEMRLGPRELAEIVESEPSLAVMMFSLAKKHISGAGRGTISLRRLCEEVPLRVIRDSFFSLQVYWPFDGDAEKVEMRRRLVTNAAAVAGCAREIAEQSSLDIDGDLAYAAGLLYSIGGLALDEAMPRSFAAMVQQAKSERLCVSDVQERNLGLDYTVLGRRLAVKWHLPKQVQMAAWLHLGQSEVVTQAFPQWDVVQAVHLGYILARKFEIGLSGSYDSVELPPDEQLPGIGRTELENIAEAVKQRIESRIEYNDWQKELAEYGKAVQAAAALLAEESSKAAAESRRALTKASHFDFATEFLTSIDADAEPIEVARRFVCQWQRFYQTGAACLYLPGAEGDIIDAVVVGGDNAGKVVTIRPPHSTTQGVAEEDAPVIPHQIQRDFAVIDAAGVCGWLFEQLETQFDAEQTKVAPLLCHGNAIGAIVFEFRYPVATSAVKEMFEQTCFVAAAALDAALARSRQERFAERFARLAMKPRIQDRVLPVEAGPKTEDGGGYIAALAELAAGAAHELNNPLSVISGRAQLLARGEADTNKAEALGQIRDNCRELSRIVEDLMSFAQPPQPRKALVAVRQIIEEAVELAAMKTHREHIDTQLQLDDAVNDVFVDSGQIVSSLASIIANAVESYGEKPGQVNITARRSPDLSGVRIEIIDQGCGMEAGTLAKATYPFFSYKIAGRKRGMGLAYAARLIELNGGSLELASELGKGTTATMILPCS